MAFSQEDFFKPLSEIKKDTSENLKDSYGTSIKMGILCYLAQILIILATYFLVKIFYRTTWIVVVSIVIMSFVFVFVSGTLEVGKCSYYFDVLDQKEKYYQPFTFFSNFWKYGRFAVQKLLRYFIRVAIYSAIIFLIGFILLKSVKLEFLVSLSKGVFTPTAIIVISILSFLFGLIPAINYVFKYAFVEVAMADNTQNKIKNCFAISKRYTTQYKKHFEKFLVSFIPRLLICWVTCGIYSIWFIPYYKTCKAAFYRDLKSDF